MLGRINMRFTLIILLMIIAACSSGPIRDSFKERCKRDYFSWQKSQKREATLEEANAWCAYEKIRRDEILERRQFPRGRFL